MIYRSPFRVFVSVIRALFLREINTRISMGKTGLFWTFFEPFFQTFLFVMIHASISQGSSFDMVVFMASGFIPFNMFRAILSSSTGAFIANKGLFSYKQVKPIDTILARALLELFMIIIIASIFLLLGFILDYNEYLPKNILMVIVAYCWLWVFSVGIGLILSIGGTFFISISKIVNLLSFALLFLSAVFYPLIYIPVEIQKLLLFNPLVHFMEMIHGFYMMELNTQYVNYQYMLMWTIFPWFIGLWLYKSFEKKVISV